MRPSVKVDALRELVGDEALEAADIQRITMAVRSSRESSAGHDRAGRRAGPVAVNTRLLHFFDLETGEGIYGES